MREDGTAELDAAHLLWAACKVDPARGLISAVSADPDMLAHGIAEARRGAAGASPDRSGFTPAAQRLLADAHLRARAAGAVRIGPEHVLGALLAEDARNPGSGAAAVFRADTVDVARLRTLVDRAAARGG